MFVPGESKPSKGPPQYLCGKYKKEGNHRWLSGVVYEPVAPAGRPYTRNKDEYEGEPYCYSKVVGTIFRCCGCSAVVGAIDSIPALVRDPFVVLAILRAVPFAVLALYYYFYEY